MNIKEHRIYTFMSEPLRIGGMTVDELCFILISIFLFFVLESLSLKLFFIIAGSLGVYLIKRFKKLVTGFSLISYLHWTLGLRFGLPRICPESWKRIWLP
jgi:type IV conjugative transfer system protein TraL